MLSKVVNYFDHFNPEILYTLFGILLINIGLFIWFWIHNKKKYDNLKYQVPPEVLKSHLDAMMQNTSAVNSIANQNAQNPSIVSAKDFAGGGDNVSVGSVPSSGANNNELINAKNNEINSLREELNQKTNQLSEASQKNDELDLEIEQKNNYIKDLEARLSKEPQDEDGQKAQNEEMQNLIKERDELKERLDEYAVIEDDLADLKRYKQENDELRKALADGGNAVPNLADSSDEEIEQTEDIIDEDISDDDTNEPDSLEALANALESDDSKTEEAIEGAEKVAAADTASEADLLDDATKMLDEVAAEPVQEATNEEESASEEANLAQDSSEEEAPVATQDKDAEEGEQEQIAAAQNNEEATSAKTEVEEEKSLDDLLSEFEKMLG